MEILTPLVGINVSGDTGGIRRVTLYQRENKREAEWRFESGVHPWASELHAWIKSYYRRNWSELPELPIAIDATEFQRKVLQEIRRIPPGETISYGGIAENIGKPKAARATGGACGKNPIPLLIPCHRVIRSEGAIGGYSGPEGIKKLLLGYEND